MNDVSAAPIAEFDTTAWENLVRLWPQWGSLPPLAKLMSLELARLSDLRGVCAVAPKHLETFLHCRPSAVDRCIQELMQADLLRQEPFTLDPTMMRMQLLGGDAYVHNRPVLYSMAQRELLTLLSKFDPSTQETSKRSRSAQLTALSQWLETFWDPDTRATAWTVLQEQKEQVLEAKNPVALLRFLVMKELQSGDCGRGETEMQPIFGVDDLPEMTIQVVGQLEKKISTTIAWAALARVCQFAGIPDSRRHWLAARDHKLHQLGIDAQTARRLVTLVYGSRRGRPGLLWRLHSAA